MDAPRRVIHKVEELGLLHVVEGLVALADVSRSVLGGLPSMLLSNFTHVTRSSVGIIAMILFCIMPRHWSSEKLWKYRSSMMNVASRRMTVLSSFVNLSL
eukprot:10155941-Lingulodinium_polyedra.AAC.1